MNRFMRRVVDNRDETSLAAEFRRKRFRLFLELIDRLPRPVEILDVGGETRFWEVMGLAGDADYQVILLNQAPLQTYWPNLRFVPGDAADLSRFAGRQFAAVFSNSVIEHLGSYERQQRMAAEVQRVGERYFIQTPNRYFPLEPHFLVPFFQFYPQRLQIALHRRFDLGWYSRIPDRELAARHVRSHRLLTAGEMRNLFPGGEVYKETVLGWVKSLIAYGPTQVGAPLAQERRQLNHDTITPDAPQSMHFNAHPYPGVCSRLLVHARQQGHRASGNRHTGCTTPSAHTNAD